MGRYKQEEVLGFDLNEGIFCCDCVGERNITENSIITEKDVEEEYVFCGKCGKQITT